MFDIGLLPSKASFASTNLVVVINGKVSKVKKFVGFKV
jgi:hypothetical protein